MRRWITVLLVLALAVTLMACRKNSAAEESTAAAATEAAVPETESETVPGNYGVEDENLGEDDTPIN